MQLHSKCAQLRRCALTLRASAGRAAEISVIAGAVAIWPALVSAQNPTEVRFQSPTRGEIVARYADGVLSTEGASDVSSGKWWTGS